MHTVHYPWRQKNHYTISAFQKFLVQWMREIIYIKVQCDSIYYWDNARIPGKNMGDNLEVRISFQRSSAYTELRAICQSTRSLACAAWGILRHKPKKVDRGWVLDGLVFFLLPTSKSELNIFFLLPDKLQKNKNSSFGVYVNKVRYIHANLNLDQEYNSILSRDSLA